MHPAATKFTPFARLAWQASGYIIAAGVFLAAYIDWRPAAILFTFSDLLFIVGAVALLFASRMSLRPLGNSTAYWYFAVSVMLLGLFLGSMINGDPVRWLIATIQYSFGLIILPILLINQGQERTHLFARAQIAGVVMLELGSIAMLVIFKGDYEELKIFGQEFVTGTGRLSSLLADPNWNAAVIAMTLPFLYYFRVRRLIGQFSFYFSLSILFTALVLCASVTGTVGAVLASAIFVIVGRIRISRMLVLVAVASTALFIVSRSELPQAFQNRVAPAFESGDLELAGTYTGRIALIREAWNMTGNTMIVGLGADQFRVVSVSKAPVHNLFLLLWTEGGLPAMLAWLALMGILVSRASRAVRINRLDGAFALSVFSAFFVFSAAAPHMYARMWVVPLFLALAPALALKEEKDFSRTRLTRRRGLITTTQNSAHDQSGAGHR